MTDYDPNAPAPVVDPNAAPAPQAFPTDQTPPPAAEQPVDASGAPQTPAASTDPAPVLAPDPADQPVQSIQQQVADQREHTVVTEHFRVIFDQTLGLYSVIRADWIGDDGVSFHQSYLEEFKTAVAGL